MKPTYKMILLAMAILAGFLAYSIAFSTLNTDVSKSADLPNADDGQAFTSDEKVVSDNVRDVLNGLKQAASQGAMADPGDSDALFIVHVTDTHGKPLADASMDVRLYFHNQLHGKWDDLPASDKGEIEAFVPCYFANIRTVLLVVKAKGYESRMLRLDRFHNMPGDTSMKTTEEDWARLMTLYAKGTYKEPPHTRIKATEYFLHRAVDIRNRRVVLQNKP